MIIIPCAGQQERWGKKEVVKQLLPIQGESILARIVRMVRAFDPTQQIVVARRQGDTRIFEECRKLGVQSLRLHPIRCFALAVTIMSVIYLTRKAGWIGPIKILLGDVVFTEETINKILGDSAQCTFFGTHYELFGVSINEPEDQFLKACRTGTKVGGKLWHVYRAYNGYPVEKHTIHVAHNNFTLIKDKTRDVDNEYFYNLAVKDFGL